MQDHVSLHLDTFRHQTLSRLSDILVPLYILLAAVNESKSVFWIVSRVLRKPQCCVERITGRQIELIISFSTVRLPSIEKIKAGDRQLLLRQAPKKEDSRAGCSERTNSCVSLRRR